MGEFTAPKSSTVPRTIYFLCHGKKRDFLSDAMNGGAMTNHDSRRPAAPKPEVVYSHVCYCKPLAHSPFKGIPHT